MKDAESLVSLASAARATGIPYQTLRRLVLAERLPSVRYSGIRRVRISQITAAIEELGSAV